LKKTEKSGQYDRVHLPRRTYSEKNKKRVSTKYQWKKESKVCRKGNHSLQRRAKKKTAKKPPKKRIGGWNFSDGGGRSGDSENRGENFPSRK